MNRISLIGILFFINIAIYSHSGAAHNKMTNDSLLFLSNTISNKNIIVEESYEDNYTDFIYGYNWPLVTVTHFWKQDNYFPEGVGLDSHPSNFTKAIKYWKYCDKCALDISGQICCGNNKDIFYEYERNFISNSEGYINVDENILFVFGGFFWRIGRIIHLLEDLSVPAHVHNDKHAKFPPDWDYYWLGEDDEYEHAWIGREEMYKLYNTNDSLGLWHIDNYLFTGYEYETWEEEISVEDYLAHNYTLDCGEDCRCFILYKITSFIPLKISIIKTCTRIIGEKPKEYISEYPLLEIFTKMNQMADYFPSDDVEGAHYISTIRHGTGPSYILTTLFGGIR